MRAYADFSIKVSLTNKLIRAMSKIGSCACFVQPEVSDENEKKDNGFACRKVSEIAISPQIPFCGVRYGNCNQYIDRGFNGGFSKRFAFPRQHCALYTERIQRAGVVHNAEPRDFADRRDEKA
jgi:hypothetical protein